MAAGRVRGLLLGFAPLLLVAAVGLVGWWWSRAPVPTPPASVVVAEHASNVTACPPPEVFTLTLDGVGYWCGRATDGEYSCSPTP